MRKPDSVGESSGPTRRWTISKPRTSRRASLRRSHRPTTTSTAASTTAAPATLSARELTEKSPVARERDAAVRFADDVLAAAASHLRQIELAVVCGPDRLRQQLGTVRRDDDSAA